MTRLFIRFYMGVLVVLFLAWYIHGAVLKRRSQADLARVVTEAHGGGARLVAEELDAAPPGGRDRILASLCERFTYEVKVVATDTLPSSVQRQISSGADIAFLRRGPHSMAVVAALSKGTEVVQLGPFPDYELQEIEGSIGGWVRLTANKINDASVDQRGNLLTEVQANFDFPVEMAKAEALPEGPRQRLRRGDDVVFYPGSQDRWFAVTPLVGTSLTDTPLVIRFGPFPSFENIEQNSATTTVAFVLLPAALAIALLLRPIAQQLRRVENAATVIAAGDLGARVDERRMNSAKPLAQAFNLMASRTESLVRTQRELLQAVSHELRTPLSRIRFAIDLIETARDASERQQRLATLDASATELDELVEELLRYVRLETADTELHRENLALQDLLDVLIHDSAAVHPSIRFELSDVDTGHECNAFVDRIGFQRAIGNLLSNAARFAKSHVAIRTELGEGTTIVDVDDDGCGIPAADRQRVFEPFLRLDSHVKDQGVGLGLAIVKRIVTQHGGTVTAMASPSGGCRIRTTWPRESPAAARTRKSAN